MSVRAGTGSVALRALDAYCLCAAFGLGALFLLGQDAEVARLEFPLDDAWIHLVYARSLFHEGSLAYNPGVPEAGASSLLYVVLLSPLAGLCPWPSLVLAVKAVSLTCAALTAAGVARLARCLGDAPALPWLAATWVLLSPSFGFAAVSGMEVTLAAALLAWALAAYADKHMLRAGLLLALAGLARPECAVATLALLAVERRRATLPRLLLPSLLAAGLWFALNLSVTGYPLPNTFYVKGEGAPLRGLHYLGERVLLDHGSIYALVSAALAAVGAWHARRSGKLALMLVPLWPLLAVACVHSLDPRVGFYMQRYFLPFTPFDAPLCAAGLVSLAERLPQLRLSRALPFALVVLLAAPPMFAQRAGYLDHCRDIFTLHTRPALEVIRALPASHVVAVEGAGASRFFGEREIIDLVALNDHQLAHVSQRGVRPCLVMARKPDVFVVPSDYAPQLAHDYELEWIAGYSSPRWSVYRGARPREVVALRAQARPEQDAFCRRVLASARAL